MWAFAWTSWIRHSNSQNNIVAAAIRVEQHLKSPLVSEKDEPVPSWLLKCIRPSSPDPALFFPSKTWSLAQVKRPVPLYQSISRSLLSGLAGEKGVWCTDSRVSKSARPIWSPEPRPAHPRTNQELVSARTRQHPTFCLETLDLCW